MVFNFCKSFFYEKTACVFRRFFRCAKHGDGGFWVSRVRWSSCFGVGRKEGGSFQNTRKRSRALVPIFAHDAWVYRGGGSGAVRTVYTFHFVRFLSWKSFNQCKSQDHPSARASASRLSISSVPRSACLPATLPRFAWMWAGLRGQFSASRTPWRGFLRGAPCRRGRAFWVFAP